ncbi:hypothetical protein [Enterococcus wangshanyuanii]|uniref:Uncharacterized protein n=1 Tax=Enterococcus wangshanyuanii TaxID=2005703 RepID=A0ABQ1PQL7_9ENTE|nr:hypothetical protein [Enterococcus wangshanyuanii]GGD01544.1 hypothetical protein GCM10011573_33920 [Enterococcus wangshanyuanii]
MKDEQNDKDNFIILRPRNTQPIVLKPTFGEEVEFEEHGPSFGFVIMFLLGSIIILISLLTLWNQLRSRRRKQQVLTLIECSANRTLVYDEHVFSKEIDIYAYDSVGLIREKLSFPLKYKKCIEIITQENKCKLISSEEYTKKKDRLEAAGDGSLVQEEIFSIYLASGGSFEHDMSEVKTDKEYIKNVVMNFQVDHFTIEDADGISSYKTCNVEAMTMEVV